MPNLFKRNKKAFFEALYNNYSERLYLLILRYVVSQFDAEEVLQRGFIKAYANLKSFKLENDKATLGWLNRIMVNEALLFLREQKRLSLSDDITETGVSLLQQPDAEADINYEACLSLVRQLPDGYRTVFNLYAIEGYSHKEISELLKITESASRSQLSRARTILQEQLKTVYYGTEQVR
jgi:RNA polymerase sigma-70 factor (ECF subfamily)